MKNRMYPWGTKKLVDEAHLRCKMKVIRNASYFPARKSSNINKVEELYEAVISIRVLYVLKT
jgi:hypothetical protein